jgi:hypothetical protein
VAVDQAGVLADPAQSGIARQCPFQHGGRVDEGAVAERADLGLHALGQLLQAVAHQLVVVAAERVAGHVGAFAIGQRGPGFGIVAAAVVQPDRDHPQGTGHQFGRALAQPVWRAIQSIVPCMPASSQSAARRGPARPARCR